MSRHLESSDPWEAAIRHERLRLLALGVEASDMRAGAIIALAETDDPSRARHLETILRDEATPIRLRHLAAILLGKIDSDAARDVLLGALEISDERLLGRIAHSLGRIGHRAAFTPIERASARLTGFPLTQARFAQRLLAHRLDLDLPDTPDPQASVLPKPGEGGHSFALLRAHPIEAQIAARSLAREPFGIELDESTAHHIRCDDAELIVLFDHGLGVTSGVVDFMSRKRLAGVVGCNAGARGLYSPSLLILTVPDGHGERLEVSLYQPNGTLVLMGDAARKGKGFAFELRAVARRGGVAMHVAGGLVGRAITLRTARVGCVHQGAGHPDGLQRTRRKPPSSSRRNAAGLPNRFV